MSGAYASDGVGQVGRLASNSATGTGLVCTMIGTKVTAALTGHRCVKRQIAPREPSARREGYGTSMAITASNRAVPFRAAISFIVAGDTTIVGRSERLRRYGAWLSRKALVPQSATPRP
jgi:hypothetical protein